MQAHTHTHTHTHRELLLMWSVNLTLNEIHWQFQSVVQQLVSSNKSHRTVTASLIVTEYLCHKHTLKFWTAYWKISAISCLFSFCFVILFCLFCTLSFLNFSSMVPLPRQKIRYTQAFELLMLPWSTFFYHFSCTFTIKTHTFACLKIKIMQCTYLFRINLPPPPPIFFFFF